MPVHFGQIYKIKIIFFFRINTIKEQPCTMGKGGFCGCCTTAVVIGFLIFLSIVLIALGAGSIPFLAKFYRKTVENVLFFFILLKLLIALQANFREI